MTGTGTKADPYIVGTWTELTQTIVQSDVYIQLGQDIDCKSLGAITVTTSSGYGVYDMNCTELDGRDYAIKNAFFLNCSAIFGGVKANTIKNLKFKNIYLSNSVLFTFRSDHPLYYILPTFIDCDFSVEAANNSTVFNSYTTHLYAAVFRRCSFYAYGADERCCFVGLNRFTDDRVPILLDDCVVELRGKFAIALSVQLVNTHVFGEITVSYAYDAEHCQCIRVYNKGNYHYYTSEFMKSNSIIDLIVHNDTGEQLYAYIDSDTYRDDGGDYHYEIDSLFVNTEVLENFAYSATGGASEFKRCTTSQIHDETYLRGQGFNAETLINDRYITKESLTCERYSIGGAYIDTGLTNVRYRKTLVQWEYSSIDVECWVAGGVRVNYGGVMHGTQDGIALYDGTYGDNSMNIRSDFSYGIVGTKLESMSTGSGSDSYQTDYNFIINGRNLDGRAMRGIGGKIYSVKIWETDNSLLRNFVPAYDTVEQIHGMYDTVNSTFYGSSSDVLFPDTEETPFKFVDGELQHNKANNLMRLGAFINATLLSQIEIPESVKHIGKYAFTNTALSSVTIASDCEYYDTSFPSGCEVHFY